MLQRDAVREITCQKSQLQQEKKELEETRLRIEKELRGKREADLTALEQLKQQMLSKIKEERGGIEKRVQQAEQKELSVKEMEQKATCAIEVERQKLSLKQQAFQQDQTSLRQEQSALISEREQFSKKQENWKEKLQRDKICSEVNDKNFQNLKREFTRLVSDPESTLSPR